MFPENGLLIDKRMRQYFYKFFIIIAPIGAPTDDRWRIVVLDKKLLKSRYPKGPKLLLLLIANR